MKKFVFIAAVILYGSLLFAADTLERVAVLGKKGTGPSEFKSIVNIRVKNNKLYVLDSGNYRVVVFGEGARAELSFGKFGAGSGEFNSPSRLAVDSKGCIYVLDYYSMDYDKTRAGGAKQYYYPRIQKFSPDGRFLFSFGASGVKQGEFLCTPSDMAVDKQDRLIILDSCNSRIQVFGPEGKFILTYGSFGSCDSCMDRPYRIDVDAENNLLVLDPGNSRFIKFDSLGNTMPMTDIMGKEEGQVFDQYAFKILDNGEIAVLSQSYTGVGNVWNGTAGKYSITVKIKYFDKTGKFIRYTDAFYQRDFERPPYDYQLVYRGFVDIGPDNSVYLLDTRNIVLEKYAVKNVFIDTGRLTKKLYTEGSVGGGRDTHVPVPGDPGYAETSDSRISGKMGVNVSYAIDDRSSVVFDLSGTYGRGDMGYKTNIAPTPVMEIYESETYGGRISMTYNRTYDLNENKNINANIAFEYTGDLQWLYPGYVIWHDWAHAVHSNLYGSAGIDILPNLNLTCGGNYYFWADYYSNEDWEHPDWNAYARFTLGF